MDTRTAGLALAMLAMLHHPHLARAAGHLAEDEAPAATQAEIRIVDLPAVRVRPTPEQLAEYHALRAARERQAALEAAGWPAAGLAAPREFWPAPRCPLRRRLFSWMSAARCFPDAILTDAEPRVAQVQDAPIGGEAGR